MMQMEIRSEKMLLNVEVNRKYLSPKMLLLLTIG